MPIEDSKAEMARQAALYYHEHPRPGKLEIRPTKPLANPQDLARAYSPGVAEASLGHQGKSGRRRALYIPSQSGGCRFQRHGNAWPW